jgi:ribonuclease HI
MVQNWSIHYGWVKTQVGIEENELADRLVNEAAGNDGDLSIENNGISISTVSSELKKEGLSEWESIANGALRRSFFQTLEQRLKLKIPFKSEFTAIVFGDRKTK